MPLTLEDRLDLISMPGRYGNAVDDRNWDELRFVFIDDAVFEVRPMGVRMEGLDEIVAFMDMTDAHPLSHLMTNIVMDQRGGKILVRFRAIFPIPNDDGSPSPNRIRTGFYYDEVIKTAEGWRVNNRLFTFAPKDMKPTRIDIAKNHGLVQLLTDELALPPATRPQLDVKLI